MNAEQSKMNKLERKQVKIEGGSARDASVLPHYGAAANVDAVQTFLS